MPNRTTAKDRLAGLARAANEQAIDQLAEVDTTQPLDQRPTGLVPVNGGGRSVRDRIFADGIRLAEHADHLRFDAQTTVNLNGVAADLDRLLEQAIKHGQAHERVPAELVADLPRLARELAREAESWALHRGLDTSGEDGGS